MKLIFHGLIFLAAMVSTSMHVPASSSVAEIPRSRTSFNDGWLFARYGSMPDGTTQAEPANLENPVFDDAAWRRLNLPHDWGIEGPFRKELPSGTGKLPWAGIGWYRKHFTVPVADSGRRFFVDFDGAMSHAKVWLNGQYLGEWPYGYASFRFDMTRHLRFGKENVLAVRLDNPPNSSRWYPGGGIYRNVWLVVTSPVHAAHWGTFVFTPSVSKERATVTVAMEIENQSSAPARIEGRIEIADAATGSTVATGRIKTLAIPAGQTRERSTDLVIHSPKLWNLDAPHLYRARTIIREGEKTVDASEITFGVRTAVFTPDNGFVLNGKRVRINGVCDHHDLGPLGAAVNASALRRQIRILQEMGCNAIRTSHNPPAPELLDLCDTMGMLVLDEAFDCWIKAKTPNDYSTLFEKWHEKDIRAYVRRDRNHPCVVAWSSGNEVWEQENGVLAQKLTDLFHRVDPTRPVTSACNGADAGFNGFQNAVDIFGYNYKPHLYGRFHEENPAKPLFGSETASCISTRGEYFFPVSDDKVDGLADAQVSSYDLYAPPWATIPDVEFEAQDRNPFVAGEFVWTGFDYLGEPTPYGEDTSGSRSSYFGIVDLCGFKKDRFYLYQARWRPELPMAHILPHWNWPERIGQITPVHVYTSGDQAELYLNGRSLGRQVRKPYQYRFRWDDVKYEPGVLNVVVYKDGRIWAADTVRTTGTAARLSLSADRSTMSADGRDLAFVSVAILDKDGLVVPTAENPIRFRVEGVGEFVAAGNGDPTNLEPFQTHSRDAFNGRCLVIIRSLKGEPGIVRLKADSEGLAAGEVSVSAR
jgi:beta-galactosidase